MRCNRVRSLLVLAIVWAAQGSLSLAQQHVDAENHFAFEPPAGWQSITQAELAEMNAKARQQYGPETPPFLAAYRAPGLVERAPYVAVEMNAIATGDWSYDVVEASVLESLGDQSQAEDPIVPDFDRGRNRARYEMLTEDERLVQPVVTTATSYGKAGFVNLYFYIPEAELDRWRPVVDRSIDSFRFDPGWEFVPAPPVAGPVRDDARRFGWTPPAGWDVIPADQLQNINQAGGDAMRKIGHDPVAFVAGYRAPGPLSESPYLLLQINPNSLKGISYDQFERQLKKEMAKDLENARAVRRTMGESDEVSMAPPKLERGRHRLLTELTMVDPLMGPVRALNAANFGKEVTVNLHAYFPEARGDRWRPVLQQALDSFAFDQGYAYEPRPSGLLGGGLATRRLIVFAGIALVAGLVLWVVKTLLGKSPAVSPRPRPRPRPKIKPDDDLFGPGPS